MHYLKPIILFVLFFQFSESKAMPADSTRLFYYSFMEDQVIELSTLRSVDYHKEITICSGSNLLLNLPKKFKNANFTWTGPDGFTSYTPEVNFEKVHISQSGTYKVEIQQNERIQTGIFEVKVNHAPEAEIKIKNNLDFLKLNLVGIPDDVKVNWVSQDQTLLGTYKELIISKKNKAANGLFVELKGEHCSNTIKIQ